MGKNKGIKVTSLFIGVLLCMVSMQIAFAQPEANITTENVTIENNTIEHKIDPQSYFTGVYAGSGTQFTVSFTNQGSETLTIEPKLVPNPQSEKNMDESWITASPANANVAPGSSQKFVIEVNVPRDTKGGNYQSIITFTDDLVPNFNGYFNSMNLEISVQALPKIQLETQYISDTIDACKEYEYKVNMKNVADKDVTIDPKLLKYNPYYDPSYIPAFDSDAIEISAPSIVKAGETANMTIKVKVPENATGRYYGTISMNVEGEEEANIYGSNSQINIDFTVFKQPLVPYVNTFKTATNDPITIEVSTDTYSYNPWLQSPKKEKPSFELKLRHNRSPVNMTFVKTIESGTVSIGEGYYPPAWPMSDKAIYQSSGKHYAEIYTVPGALGDWDLSILPRNTQSFGYSITVEDSKYSKLGK